jgi:hypothetical protein
MAKKQTVQADQMQIQIPTLPGWKLEPDKRMRERIIAGELMLLGIDVGYGVTKALSWGFDPVLFPTVYGYSRPLSFRAEEIARRYPGDQIEDDYGTWFVGGLAQSQLQSYEQLTLRGRDNANDIRRLMMLTAIGKMFPAHDSKKPLRVRIATGLPVDHIGGASALKQALIGRYQVSTEQSSFPVEIEAVSVMPQPYGTINAYSLMPNGDENPYYTFRRIAVLDNGTFSVDLSTDDEGEPIQAQSGTAETGTHTAYERIAALYEERFEDKPDTRLIERIMREKKFKVRNEWHDWTGEVDDMLLPMRQSTINLCRVKIAKALQHEAIFNVGGPAPLVGDLVRREYPQTVSPNNSQITNALGYLHYAAFAAQEGL